MTKFKMIEDPYKGMITSNGDKRMRYGNCVVMYNGEAHIVSSEDGQNRDTVFLLNNNNNETGHAAKISELDINLPVGYYNSTGGYVYHISRRAARKYKLGMHYSNTEMWLLTKKGNHTLKHLDNPSMIRDCANYNNFPRLDEVISKNSSKTSSWSVALSKNIAIFFKNKSYADVYVDRYKIGTLNLRTQELVLETEGTYSMLYKQLGEVGL